MSIAVICPICSHRQQVADSARSKVRCPECGVMCDVPPEGRAAPRETPRVKPASPFETMPTAEAAELATKVAAQPLRIPQRDLTPPPTDDEAEPERCPKCQLMLAPDAVVCLACGFNLQAAPHDEVAGKKRKWQWEAGWPLATRVRFFVGGISVAGALGLLGAW